MGHHITFSQNKVEWRVHFTALRVADMFFNCFVMFLNWRGYIDIDSPILGDPGPAKQI